MFARLIVGILGGLLLGIAGAGLCMLAFGSNSGYWGLLLFWSVGIATSVAAPDVGRASRWLLIAAGLAVLLLVFTSAIVSDRLLPGGGDALRAPDHRNDIQILALGMLLGALALFAGLWIGRDPAPRVNRAGHDRTPADFDSTAATGRLPVLEATQLTRPLQLTLIAGALLLVCALLVWTTRESPPAAHDVAAEAVAAAPPEAALTAASATESAPGSALPAETLAPAGAAATTALTSSQARHECMAQIEAARLFLGHARASESRGDYEVKVGEEIERLRRDKPVGPRTLTLISTAMWGRRAAPDPDAKVWSREYARCEQTRLGGSYYVVRGSG